MLGRVIVRVGEDVEGDIYGGGVRTRVYVKRHAKRGILTGVYIE